ncbi:MAG: HAD family hydrolase [Anaerolineales bacterium]|nr:HAD family hydrolase [Anaerolineales bacterium]
MPKKIYSHIIWDWNGTLLDDLNLCLTIINTLLAKYNLPPISSEKYLEVFGFPVIEYYRILGFNFDDIPFEIISTEFITAYENERPNCQLMTGALETLKILSSSGYTQSILSASRKDFLTKAVRDYGIQDYFLAINGLDNHHASGKLDLAREFIKAQNLDPTTVLFIGDTMHDAEIASELGVDCWLIPTGHHSRQRLESAGVPIMESLANISEYL